MTAAGGSCCVASVRACSPSQGAALVWKAMGIENPVHLLFVGAVALIVLGPKRLPEVAKALGHGIREFREAISQPLGEHGQTPPRQAPPRAPSPPSAAPAPPAAAPAQTPAAGAPMAAAAGPAGAMPEAAAAASAPAAPAGPTGGG